ncbi:MAG: DUF4442 domain-containing protein [Spirochaetes bacterium]|nr:DUF4442 domain-containing protein [Spirochaetota bacterium]
MKTIFKTHRKESLKSKIVRVVFTLFPAYRRTGGRVVFLSSDFREAHIRLSMNWRTVTVKGAVFGGSIYGSLDPVYMSQLVHLLGKDYVLWDKTATIKYIKPIRGTVYAKFLITDEILGEIKTHVKNNSKYTIHLDVVYQDKHGTVYAEVIKGIYIADKTYYRNKINGTIPVPDNS